MTAGLNDQRTPLTKGAVVLITSLILMSGAALASREDTFDFNIDLLRERLEAVRLPLPAVMGRFKSSTVAE